MSKEYYKKKLIDLRRYIADERDAKKRDNANYAQLIKNAGSAYSKASYRKNKIDRAAYHDRRIESWKAEIERVKDSLRRCK